MVSTAGASAMPLNLQNFELNKPFSLSNIGCLRCFIEGITCPRKDRIWAWQSWLHQDIVLAENQLLALLGLRLLDVLIGRMQLSLTARSLDGSVCCFGLKAFSSQCHGNARLGCSWCAFPMWSNLFLKEGIYPFIHWTLRYYTLTARNLFSARYSSSFLPLLPIIIFIIY